MIWVSVYDDTCCLLCVAADSFSAAQGPVTPGGAYPERDSRELRAEESSLEMGSLAAHLCLPPPDRVAACRANNRAVRPGANLPTNSSVKMMVSW